MVGNLGDISCFSFYANKVLTCGEGGIVCTNKKKYYKKINLLKNLGFTKPRFVHKVLGIILECQAYKRRLVYHNWMILKI